MWSTLGKMRSVLECRIDDLERVIADGDSWLSNQGEILKMNGERGEA